LKVVCLLGAGGHGYNPLAPSFLGVVMKYSMPKTSPVPKPTPGDAVTRREQAVQFAQVRYPELFDDSWSSGAVAAINDPFRPPMVRAKASGGKIIPEVVRPRHNLDMHYIEISLMDSLELQNIVMLIRQHGVNEASMEYLERLEHFIEQRILGGQKGG